MTNTANTTTRPTHQRRDIDHLDAMAMGHMNTADEIIGHVFAGTLRDGQGGTNPDAAFIAGRLRHAAELLSTAAAWIEGGR